MTEIAEISAVDLLAKYRSGEASPVDATQASFQRIAKYESRLNAFCYLDEESAMAAARASEERWHKGAPVGLLDGVPTTIKDTIMMKGWPFLLGTRVRDPKDVPTEDTPAVERVRDHNAVILGKTNTPEFGWKGVTDSPRFGITRNPWNLDLTPGGSSGGAAASVSTGISPLALGTDGGGSIRIPTSFTNLVGFKATHGRVPLYPVSPFGSLANVCPMARTVGDVALLLMAIKGIDIRDWLSLSDDRVDYSAILDDGIKGLKVAFSPTLGYADVDPEVAQIVTAAAAKFEDLGATVELVETVFDDPTPTFEIFWRTGAANALRIFDDEQLKLIEEGLVETGNRGQGISALDFLAARAARQTLAQHMSAFHQNYDLLLTPTLAVPPFPVGMLVPPEMESDDWKTWTPFTYPFNMTKQPAASVPCGFTKSGLPIGLQIVAGLRRDDLVLRAARAYETACPWHKQRPPLLSENDA
jgi:aspartyl-tRNA(Asn)/glutamyl-tRNA(Gln) amidotransferase subunit A